MTEMTGKQVIEIFDDTRAKLKNGDITLEEANQIGQQMPKGYEFEFFNLSEENN